MEKYLILTILMVLFLFFVFGVYIINWRRFGKLSDMSDDKFLDEYNYKYNRLDEICRLSNETILSERKYIAETLSIDQKKLSPDITFDMLSKLDFSQIYMSMRIGHLRDDLYLLYTESGRKNEYRFPETVGQLICDISQAKKLSGDMAR